MKEGKPAAFNFESYKIKSFSFSEPEDDESNLIVNFGPSGIYIQEQGIFTLSFEFVATLNGNDFLKALMEANFKFSPGVPFDDLPSYFYRNAIAIVYPYLRAFVSTLTLSGNVKPLILPVLNLTQLEQTFRENTVSA